MNFIKMLFIIAITFAGTTTQAQQANISPYEVATNVGNSLFSRIIEERKSAGKTTEQTMERIVEQELMPYIDHRYAAFKILGKNLRKLDKSQREEFANNMRLYLTKTYAQALTQYNNQQVTFEQPSDIKDKRIVPVKAIIAGDSQDTVIVFQMRLNSKTKQWKAFDMVVEGISLLSAKQAEFASKIRQVGIQQVTQELAQFSQSE